jgi:hypothetical protein
MLEYGSHISAITETLGFPDRRQQNPDVCIVSSSISKTLCLICRNVKKDQQFVEMIEFRVKSISDGLMGR